MGHPSPACNSNTPEKGSSDAQAVSPKTNAACTASGSQMSTRQPYCLIRASIPTYEGFRTPPPEMRDAHRSKSGGGNAAHLRARAARNLTSALAEPAPPPSSSSLLLARVPLDPLPPSLLASSSAPVSPLYFLSPLRLVPHARTFSGKFRGTGEPREIHSLTTLSLAAS